MIRLMVGAAILAASAYCWYALSTTIDIFSISAWLHAIKVVLAQPDYILDVPKVAIPILFGGVGPIVGAGILIHAVFFAKEKTQVITIRPALAGLRRKKDQDHQIDRVIRPKFAETHFQPPENPVPVSKPVPYRKPEVTNPLPVEESLPFRSESFIEQEQETQEPDQETVRGPGLFARFREQIGTKAVLIREGMQQKAQGRKDRKEAARQAKNAANVPEPVVIEEQLEPIDQQIISWYALWTNYKAQNKPPRMLDEAVRLYALYTQSSKEDQDRLTENYGMQGLSAFRTLGVAARRAAEQQVPEILPEQPENNEFENRISDIDMAEHSGVRSNVPIVEDHGPLVIEDDIGSMEGQREDAEDRDVPMHTKYVSENQNDINLDHWDGSREIFLDEMMGTPNQREFQTNTSPFHENQERELSNLSTEETTEPVNWDMPIEDAAEAHATEQRVFETPTHTTHSVSTGNEPIVPGQREVRAYVDECFGSYREYAEQTVITSDGAHPIDISVMTMSYLRTRNNNRVFIDMVVGPWPDGVGRDLRGHTVGVVAILMLPVPKGHWQIVKNPRAAMVQSNGEPEDRLIVQGLEENAGKILGTRDWMAKAMGVNSVSRNIRVTCLIQLIMEKDTLVEGIEDEYEGILFRKGYIRRNEWLETIEPLIQLKSFFD